MALMGWDCVTWAHVFPLRWLLGKADTLPHAFQPACQATETMVTLLKAVWFLQSLGDPREPIQLQFAGELLE